MPIGPAGFISNLITHGLGILCCPSPKENTATRTNYGLAYWGC